MSKFKFTLTFTSPLGQPHSLLGTKLIIYYILMQDAAPAPLLVSGSSGIVTVLLALPRRLVLRQTRPALSCWTRQMHMWMT